MLLYQERRERSRRERSAITLKVTEMLEADAAEQRGWEQAEASPRLGGERLVTSFRAMPSLASGANHATPATHATPSLGSASYVGDEAGGVTAHGGQTEVSSEPNREGHPGVGGWCGAAPLRNSMRTGFSVVLVNRDQR